MKQVCNQHYHELKYYCIILVPGSVHNLTVLVTSNTSVTIIWHPPLIINGIVVHYLVILCKYDDDVINEWTLEPQEDFQHNISGLSE